VSFKGTLSPLLFNLVFDSLMTTLLDPQIASRGVLWEDGVMQSLWMQFADDAAILSDNHIEAQLVITFFQKWAAWADLPIRTDKSFTYGAAQQNGRYQQIFPSLQLIRINIPVVALSEPMTYLGRCFSYSAAASFAKELLTTTLLETLTFVGVLPITPLLKFDALNLKFGQDFHSH